VTEYFVLVKIKCETKRVVTVGNILALIIVLKDVFNTRQNRSVFGEGHLDFSIIFFDIFGCLSI